MRVLLVTDFYHPYTGGVENHVRTIATELAARGHDVGVATMEVPAGRPRRDRDGPVTVFTVGHSARTVGAGFADAERPWAPPAPDPVAMRGLRRIVHTFDPDVIHGHDWLARSAQPRIVSGSVPIVTSLHYYTRTCAKKTLWRHGRPCTGPGLIRCLRCAGDHYGPLRGAVVTLGLRAGTAVEDRRTSRFVAVSRTTATGNDLTVGGDTVVVPNPLTAAVEAGGGDLVTPGPVPAAVPDGPFVLYVGDVRPEKGVGVLAVAMETLHRDHGDGTPLVVAGAKPADAPPLPPGTVELGPLDHATVLSIWPRATVGVVPSLWPEPFGLVAIEAMAAGCPLVASDIGGLSEILGDGRAVLVEPGDHRALALALHRLLTDEAARSAISAAATIAADRYRVGPVVDELEAIYRSVVRR